MNDIKAQIRNRRSVRTFEERPLTDRDRETICSILPTLENPYGIPLEFKLLEGMDCPVVVGTELYIGAKMKQTPYLNEAFGYTFEQLILHAQSLGIGTVWIGGTMDRTAFEKAMDLREEEIMPCVTPLGYPAQKMSLREITMRKGIRADTRMDFTSICYNGSFSRPLTKEEAGDLYLPLEMVRLAPSAVNKQPWRILVKDQMVHFYLRRAKGFRGGTIDMQKIDMGIALCHFALTASELGISAEFTVKEPAIPDREDLEYIASYRIR